MSRKTLLVLVVAAMVVAAVVYFAIGRPKKPIAPPLPPLPPPVAPAEPPPLELGGELRGGALKLPEVQGRVVTLAQLAGPAGLLVLVSSSSCPQDAAWEDRMVALGNEAQQLGMGVVLVEPRDAARTVEEQLAALDARRKSKGHAFPMTVDAEGELVRTYAAKRTPAAFVFGPRGRLAYHGAIDDNAQDGRQVTATWLRDAVVSLVRGSEVPVAQTPVVGCEIAPQG